MGKGGEAGRRRGEKIGRPEPFSVQSFPLPDSLVIQPSQLPCPMSLRVLALSLTLALTAHAADQLLIEAESFQNLGGWSLDTQFVQIMGSPYLLAHGLGEPVKDATTTVKFPSTGKYRVFVRTKDWVAQWKAPGEPGKFQLLVEGKALAETFGTKSATWFWHEGGTVEITKAETALALHDLTGFDGRCDAIFFTKDTSATPPNDPKPMSDWRRVTLGFPEKPADAGSFDLVVIGGGYGGTAAAISAARMGCKVALVQDRAVLGGNGSSEVRVWAMGGIRRGLYPNIGEIVEEFQDQAKLSPGTYEEFGDDKKEKLVRAEKNIALFFNTSAIGVEKAEKRITAVIALDTRTGERRRFAGKLFCDATGHATIGFLAGADHTIRETEHLGMSNMWRWADTGAPTTFPEVPWALPLELDDFPYPQRFHAQWFWESGFNKHPIEGLEDMRDWNLRAAFGAFGAMKTKGDAESRAKHAGAKLEWVAYIGGPRESRQLLGDVTLSEQDIVEKKSFPDATVPTTWDIDLHYPKEQYAKGVAEKDPFISKAVFGKGVDRKHGYPVPYRCFYSRNIENLFMAGRNVSVTHEALGTVRVMKTGGMIGEVVGKAASLCIKNDCGPRDIYERYLEQLKELLALRGAARRDTVTDPIRLPEGYQPPAPPKEAGESGHGHDLKKLPGLVLDDAQAKKVGVWATGAGLPDFFGSGYSYAGPKADATARYEFTIAKAGRYEVRMSYSPHENRASKAPVTIDSADGTKSAVVNERVPAALPQGFVSLGVFSFEPGKPAAVTFSTKGADGNVHVDAVQLLPVP